MPVSICFRGKWRAFLRGRQRQRTVRAQNKQKNVAKTTEGDRVFATPPCPGQRRLASVVAAAFKKCIVNSSFCVRGRNCSIDVCWERKKFRVICSHLNPGSVMHVCSNDLEDLRMLVTSRVTDAHVHTCVGAQTGLGTGVLGSASSNIGTATTVTHHAEEQTSQVFHHGTSADSHEHFQQ